MNDVTRPADAPPDQPQRPAGAPPDVSRRMAWSPGSEEMDGFGLLDIWLFLRRRQFLIGFFFIALSALGALLVMERPVLYRATAKVMVAPDERPIIASDGAQGTVRIDSEAVNSQVQILRSTDLAIGVVGQIDFDALAPPAGQGVLGRLLAPVRSALARLVPNEAGHDGDDGPPVPDEIGLTADQLATLERFRSLMVVQPVANSSVVDVQFDHPDPRVAAYVANRIVDYYVEMLRIRRVADANEALDWARERLFEIQRDLEDVRRSMTATAGSDAPPDTAADAVEPVVDQGLIEGQLAVAMANLSSAQDELLALQAGARGARAALDQGLYLSALELAGASSLLARLRDDEARARAAMADAQATYSTQHPSYVSAQIELQAALHQIEVEARGFVAAMEDRAAAAAQRVALIEEQVAGLTRQNRESIQAEIPLRTLEASEQVGQTLYEVLRTRVNLIQDEIGLARADARIISRALPPSQPITPSRKVTLAAVLFLSLSVSLGIALGIELTRGGYQSTSEIARDVALMSTGVIPHVGRSLRPSWALRRRPLLGGRPGRQSQHTIALQSLLYSVRACSGDGSPAWVAIVSADKGEGKSLTAATLGQMGALSGRRTLVVNGDLRRAHLGPRVVGPAAPIHSSEIAIDTGRSLDLKLYRDERTGLDILDIAVADLFDISMGLERLREIVAGLPETYGLIVVDTPAIAAYPDALMVARLADVAVCLVQWRRTPRPMVRYVVGQLQALGQHAIIVTLNKVAMGRYKLVKSNDSRVFHRAHLYRA